MSQKRGFARMTPEERREAGRRGGLETHRRGTAYRLDSETARAAGRRAHELGRPGHSWTREEARVAAREGWRKRRARAAAAAASDGAATSVPDGAAAGTPEGGVHE